MPAALPTRSAALRWGLGTALLGALLPLGLYSVRAEQSPAPAPQTVTVTLHREPPPSERSLAALQTAPAGVEAGLLVQDLVTGEVRESQGALTPMIPASTTKLVTAAAVLGTLQAAEGSWWSTELTVPAAEWGQPKVSRLSLRGTVDPTLSLQSGPDSLRALAEQAAARGLHKVGAVALAGEPVQGRSWQEAVIETPMASFMPQEWLEARPSSPEAFRTRLHAELLDKLEAAGITVESRDPADSASGEEEGVASVRSGAPYEFLAATLRPSDNLRAEQLLASAGAHLGTDGTRQAAARAALDLLRGWGVQVAGVTLDDGSGLSRQNRLTPRTLVDLLEVMYRTGGTGSPYADPLATYTAGQNPFAESLAHAGTGGSKYGRGGTLAGRLVGSGLDVRAKTGTLPGVSALAGYVTGASGHPLAFAILLNGPEDASILDMRAAIDAWVKEVAAQY